jgi:iron(III) transport system ATP-binding protein
VAIDIPFIRLYTVWRIRKRFFAEHGRLIPGTVDTNSLIVPYEFIPAPWIKQIRPQQSPKPCERWMAMNTGYNPGHGHELALPVPAINLQIGTLNFQCGESSASPTALECRGLRKSYGNVLAINDLDLTVLRGQVLALLGPSGCGKTTVLRLMSGFEIPNAGTIRIGDRTVFGPKKHVPPEKRHLGMVFQEGVLFPHMTVWQNVAYGLSRDQQLSKVVRQMLDLVGLSNMGNRMPHELSGGQQQRVALARALAPSPEVLLLDEPFSNLDPSLRDQVRHDVLKILKDSGSTSIFVTHDQDEALFMGDVVAVMHDGRIEQVDTPEGVFHRPATRFVAEFIGMADFIPAWREGERLVTEVGWVDWPDSCDLPEGLEVMVRPDCLECHPSEIGQGIIIERQFQGAFYLYRVSLPSGRTVRCMLSHTAEFPIGATATVSLRTGHFLRPFVNCLATPLLTESHRID